MDPKGHKGTPKVLGSSCRLLSRKNNMTVVFKEVFRDQAAFHMTPQTQKDFKTELPPSHIGCLGLDQWWL